METTVAQGQATVKPIVITDATAFRLGVEDGQQGASEWVGYAYYNGHKYAQWRAGWVLGRKGAIKQGLRTAQVIPDDFAGALVDVAKNGLRYARPLTAAAIAIMEDSDWN